MWSGTTNDIPEGWRLCNEETTVNGVRIPNLQNKFVIASDGDSTFSNVSRAKTSIEGTNCYIGGDKSHNHGGNTCAHTLLVCEIPSHRHSTPGSVFNKFVAMSDDVPGNDSPNGADGCCASSELAVVGLTSDNQTAMTENAIGGSKSHKHGIPSADHIPPYYALAFIIYVGKLA